MSPTVSGFAMLGVLLVLLAIGTPIAFALGLEGPQVKRGDSSAYVRNENGEFSGGPSVVLTVNKQPTADTREVTDQIMKALDELKPSLPDDWHE